jgi:hypothetical protein
MPDARDDQKSGGDKIPEVHHNKLVIRRTVPWKGKKWIEDDTRYQDVEFTRANSKVEIKEIDEFLWAIECGEMHAISEPRSGHRAYLGVAIEIVKIPMINFANHGTTTKDGKMRAIRFPAKL